MALKLILASAAVALTTTTASRSSSDLNVIVLAQKRPDHVSNLLASLDAASYRPDAVVDVAPARTIGFARHWREAGQNSGRRGPRRGAAGR